MKQGKYGLYCPAKNEDGSWCKYTGEENNRHSAPYRPQGGTAPQPPKENRNWDKEAYEKCCSIWIAAVLGKLPIGASLHPIDFDGLWKTFQAIRADADKRFATGWDKAVKTFAQPATPADVAGTMLKCSPSDDYEAGNRAIAEAIDKAPTVEDIPW